MSDGLFVTDLGQSQETNTSGQVSTHQDIAGITVQEPAVVNFNKGVVGFNSTGLTLDGITFTAPGTPSNFTGGPIFSSSQGTAIGGSDLLSGQVDGGDSVRMAIVAQNTGSGDAFNVALKDAIPAGYIVPATLAGLNLTVRRGDGTLLNLGTDYTATLNPATGEISISLTDNNLAGNTGEDTQPGALSRGLDAQTGVTITNGSNSVVITYDLVLANTAQAGSTITNTASLTNFANTPGGPNFVPTPITDPASITLPQPAVTKVLTGTEIAGTGNNAANQAVIGELATYTITLNVPEGTTAGAQLVDSLDPGLAFVDVQSVTLSPGVTTANVVGTGPTPANVSVTNAGRTVTFNFGNIVNADTNNATAETITIVYQAVVLNTNTLPSPPGNQKGTQLEDSGAAQCPIYRLARTDRCTNAVHRSQTGTTQPVIVVEPNLTLSKGVSSRQIGPFTASITADAGNTVFYQVSISNPAGGPTAFDATLSDPLPTAFFQSEDILSVSGGGLTTADFVINNGTLQTVNPIDIAAGTTISILVQGQIIDSAPDGQEIDNTAKVHGPAWMARRESARSTIRRQANARVPMGRERTERFSTITLRAFTSKITITSPSIDKRFQGGSLTEDDTSVPTAGTNPLDEVVVGESITYDVLVNLPEGVAQNLRITDLIPVGLRLDTTFNNGTGFRIITTAADSDGQLREDFSDPSQLHPTLIPGGGGISQILNFGDVTVTADQDKANNAFLIRVRAIVTNVLSNQTGTTLTNGVVGTFTDRTRALKRR